MRPHSLNARAAARKTKPAARGGHGAGRTAAAGASREGPSRITVREATPADASAVSSLRRSLRREAGPAQGPAGAGARARSVPAAPTGRRAGVVLLAERSGRPIGMLRCAEAAGNTGRYAWVSAVYVVPDARRRGILRTLLVAADAWCRSRRLSELRLHCGLANAVGNAAWTALGFAPVKVLYRRSVPGS
jgi:GNAT superfamily N-acetyltransferase